MSIPVSMKAIVFYAPYDVRTEERPTPKIKDPKDVIVKVRYSGLCGTDLIVIVVISKVLWVQL